MTIDLVKQRVVARVIRDQTWKDPVFIVIEDDAHRTVALVLSPYTKRKFIDHTNYNQTGMVKTIELMLGLPPMNQLDLSATPLRHCFQICSSRLQLSSSS